MAAYVIERPRQAFADVTTIAESGQRIMRGDVVEPTLVRVNLGTQRYDLFGHRVKTQITAIYPLTPGCLFTSRLCAMRQLNELLKLADAVVV
jgi:hypothetical protein